MKRGNTHEVTYTDREWVCLCGDGEDANATDGDAYYVKVQAENHAEYFGGPIKKTS